MANLFFGLSTGRSGTMALANALNSEVGCLCLHEGKIRDYERSGEQVLPFLTLQNRRAYEFPDEAPDIIRGTRSNVQDIANQRHVATFGDIAYNYAPFVDNLRTLYPNAKFIFQYRDCLGFLASCAAQDGIDDTPVGWPPPGKPLSRIERFIALGRLQPRSNTPEARLWADWSVLSKNIWLWSETNRLILNGLERIPAARAIRIPFEDLRRNPIDTYRKVRTFLDLADPPAPEALRRMGARPINARAIKLEVSLEGLGSADREVWATYAEPIRQRLGYKELG